MKVSVITLFPEFFGSPLQTGILGRACSEGQVEVVLVDLRRFGEGRHQTTDDYPFGGGAGMVLKPGPVVAAIESVRAAEPCCRVVLLTPQGRLFRQSVARELAGVGLAGGLALVCGRYEGYDERIRSYCDDEVSIGDFVLMGGESAALAILEATARLVPGVLGDHDSTREESLSDGLLEYPQYTRPREFRGAEVPEVLLGGNHAVIAAWRRTQSLLRTAHRRPELLQGAELTAAERRMLQESAAGEAGE